MKRKINILLAEDNEDHLELITYGLERGGLCERIDCVTDGEQALDFLRQEGEFEEAARPDLVLLDINMPKMGGLEVLEVVKRDESLKYIPVIILSTSDVERDLKEAYRLHANSYLVKEFDKLNEMMEDFGRYWSRWNIVLD